MFSVMLVSKSNSAAADKPARRAASRQTATFKNTYVTITTPLLLVICHPVVRIYIAYSSTKFDDFRFSRSSDTIGAPKFCNGSRDLTTPLSGTLCFLQDGTFTFNLLHQTCSLCGRQLRRCIRQCKMQKLRWFNVLRGHPKVIGNITIQQSAYDFLFKFNRNYEAILYRFRDIVAYFPKIKEVA